MSERSIEKVIRSVILAFSQGAVINDYGEKRYSFYARDLITTEIHPGKPPHDTTSKPQSARYNVSQT